MDFDFTPEQQAFRGEVRAWLGAHVPADLKGRGFAASRADRAHVDRLRQWQRELHKAGYVGIDWPREYGGRGASIMEQIILYEEMSRAATPQPVNRGGLSMLGPTLMTHGTPALRERHLAKILTAEEIWCQGFSEPDPGSDLANLQTRAVLDGDFYVVNGQKVWTSMAHVADWGFLLVRTDPTLPKHKGITFLLIDMKTPGITIIRHISLRTALERLVALAKRTKRNGHTAAGDPVLRQKIASLAIAERCLQLNGYRSLTRILRGRPPGPEGSTSKLFWSQVDQDLAEVATEVIGPYSQIKGPSEWAPDEGQWEFYCLLARGSGIRAGTSEILRNILGERVLGLPKDCVIMKRRPPRRAS